LIEQPTMRLVARRLLPSVSQPHQEDANEAAFRVVRARRPMREMRTTIRCDYLWNGQRCILSTGHLETHQFRL
jgi:hypothetical protein